MAYIVPRVLINQEFSQQPVFGDQPLSALIMGPQYELFRHSEVDEKASTAVTHPDDTALANNYQAASDVSYAFPNKSEGTHVDANFTKVYAENAQVEYYPNPAVTATDGSIVRVAYPNVSGSYYANRFEASTLIFKSGDASDRSTDFSNRDVKAGDYIVLEDADATEATIRVKAVHPTKTAASLAAVTNDASNKSTQTEDFNNAAVWAGTGTEPATAPVNSSGNYDGHPALGIVSDTFTVECTYAPGALDLAEFSITSSAGAFAVKTAQVLNGTDELIIDDTNGATIKLDFTDATAPAVGDKWTLAVTAAVTPLVNASTITASGTYTGTEDLTYTLTVVRGGPLYTGSNSDVCARIAITSDGLDSSPTVNVASATTFRVGSYGVLAAISGVTTVPGLVLGDRYLIPATASVDSDIQIIESYEALPASLIANTATWDIQSMRYTADFEIPAIIDEDNDLYNWEQDVDAEVITINSGITTTNDSIVDGGVPVDLDVKTAKLYVEHRDLVLTNSVAIASVTSTDEVEAILGKIDPVNPAALGVYLAALNAGGVPTYFVTVATDDLSGYNGAIALAKKSEDYYGLVPLTFDSTIKDTVAGHIASLSTAENAKWRVGWFGVDRIESSLVYDLDADGNAWKGTVTDDPLTSGTQYKLLTVAGAEFITDGVRPTDQVLLNFRTNSQGETEYDTYTVDVVRTETTLVLTTALAAPINSAKKIKIKRINTKDEEIDLIAAVGSGYNNRRIRSVFPSYVKDGTKVYPGYFVGAALAGVRASVVPHQGLTNTEVLGFNDLEEAVSTFSETQLNRLADSGFFIVTQEARGGTAYIRHQLTTDRSSLNAAEDSITTNVDSISYGLHRAIKPFIGTHNIHPKSLVVIRNAIESELNYRATSTFTLRAGNQLNSYKIVKFEQSATFKDRIICDIQLEVPYPVNFITITLFV